MAKITTLQLNARDTNNKELLRTISNINPDASNYTLKQFAQKINGLTVNTLISTYRVDKEDITASAQGE